MSIIDRFHQLGVPADQSVIIGSGILDALALRPSRDIDLVVSSDLFTSLQASGEWQVTVVHDETVLTKDDAEVWLSWGSAGVPNFTKLYDGGVTIGGVRFADPRFVIEWKRQNAREKDLRDIQLLEEYLSR